MNNQQKTALVCGAGGFIGGHLVKRLKREGWWVRAVDIKNHEYSESAADEFIVGDLRDPAVVEAVLDQPFDRVYQLAADMGGAGFVFTGENDADIMHNSALINLNIAHQAAKVGVGMIFYSSSACIYPERNQMDPEKPVCHEDSAYPAAPDSEYGWEKIFSERIYLAFARNKGLNVRIARFHNIFGPEGSWVGGREKAPAAICRKVAEARLYGTHEIEVWGDGLQTRSFLYVDECLEGIERLMSSDEIGPLNLGSDELISINDLVALASEISEHPAPIARKHIPGPIGVRGRNSDNARIKEKLDWAPSAPLREGIAKTYKWVEEQVHKRHKEAK
jgi:nucleoside-diphosphate-sugar epimerase